MAVGRSSWSPEETPVSSKTARQQQNINAEQNIVTTNVTSHLSIILYGLAIGALVSGIALTVVVLFYVKSPSTTITTVTTTTTTAPPSTSCVTTIDKSLTNNTFLYSPTSQTYAAGILNNQFGIYIADSYGNVSSTAIWTAPQNLVEPCSFAMQTDRNLVIYASVGSGVLWTANVQNSGAGNPFCLQMLDSGNLIWTDNSSTIIWQSNSAVQSG